MKISIYRRNDKNGYGREMTEVGRVYPVKIGGECFLVHRSFVNSDFWQVTEKKTGLFVTGDVMTKKECIKKLHKCISSVSIERTKMIIQRSLERQNREVAV